MYKFWGELKFLFLSEKYLKSVIVKLYGNYIFSVRLPNCYPKCLCYFTFQAAMYKFFHVLAIIGVIIF